MFSLLPRCQGECASQKNTFVPVCSAISWCSASSALIPRQSPSWACRQPTQCFGQTGLHRLGGGPGISEVDEDEEPRAPLDERADRGAVSRTFDAIALPLPHLDTVVDLGRPVG